MDTLVVLSTQKSLHRTAYVFCNVGELLWISGVQDFTTRANMTFICYVPITFSDDVLNVSVIVVLLLQMCTLPKLFLLPSDTQMRQNFLVPEINV